MPPVPLPQKHELNEEETKHHYITPAIENAGWTKSQIWMEYCFTDGMIQVRDGYINKGAQKKADYLLSYKGIPLAVVEAKKLSLPLGAGMQQALEYADILDIPFVYASNGTGFLEHDKLAKERPERELALSSFPSPDELWKRYCTGKGIEKETEEKVTVPYYYETGGAEPRYYQRIAINRTVEAVTTGIYPGGIDKRILLVMATGSGKTFTSFQIIHRLREAGMAKRILYLADRNVLIDQTMKGDFKPFSKVMTKVVGKKMDSAFEVYMSLYQQQVAENEEDDTYKQFAPGFFDLIIVDECHRGSAKETSNWRRILEYFSSAVQIGMTATPKETKDVSNIEYFGEPLYTYSLKQGIEDGFLAPYKVIRINLDKDLDGWRPEKGQRDKHGKLIENRLYNQKDFDKELVLEKRTQVVARRVAEYLRELGGYPKTMVFCEDIDHAERMRSALVNEIGGEAVTNPKYVMRITGDNDIGKQQLEYFQDVNERYPVVATTSTLLTTGVNCKTCEVIVIDKNIESMTEFKQILGRGTRLYPKKDKYYFTLLDFRNVSRKFYDPDFDGEPLVIKRGAPAPKVKPKKEGDGMEKYRVRDVEVKLVSESVSYYSAGGVLTTESFRDFTKKTVLNRFSSLDEFLQTWSSQKKSAVISEELQMEGALLEHLRKLAGNPPVDDFDLLCHVAFDAKPLTRRERALNVQKRGYLDKYSGVARKVLETLLDKYSEEVDIDVADMRVLELSEFAPIGKLVQIGRAFGGKDNLTRALFELKSELYSVTEA